VLEAAQECAHDTLLEVRARILGDDLPSQLSRKLVITLSQNVQSYTGIEKRGFRLFVLCYSGCGVQSDRIPGGLNRGLWQLVMRKKLACGIGADHFKAIRSTIVFFDEAEIMESGAYEKQFGVVLQPCGISLGGGEKNTRWEWLKSNSVLCSEAGPSLPASGRCRGRLLEHRCP